MDLNNCIFKLMVIDDGYFFENIKNNELICKQFKDYNDPYESHYGVNAHWPHPYMETHKLENLIRRIEPEEYDRITESKKSMDNYIHSRKTLRDDTMDMISSILSNFRICSFTRRWNNILMWSHYADGCRGLALVFDRKKILDCKDARLIGKRESLNGINVPLKWVRYKKVPPVLNSVEIYELSKIGTEEAKEEMIKIILDACVLSKYKTWRYEQETRMITSIKEELGKLPILYKYDPEALKGIIFGHKCDIEKIKDIAKIIPGETNVYLTKLAASRYEVEIVQTWRAARIANGEVELRPVVEYTS